MLYISFNLQNLKIILMSYTTVFCSTFKPALYCIIFARGTYRNITQCPITIFMLYLCPAFWLHDINTHRVFSGFTSRAASLLVSNRASVLFCMVFVFSNYTIISTGQKLMCPIQFQSFLVLLDPPVAYSKAKWKSYGDKASPCFRPFWIGKVTVLG
jgi:hypothetical protein